MVHRCPVHESGPDAQQSMAGHVAGHGAGHAMRSAAARDLAATSEQAPGPGVPQHCTCDGSCVSVSCLVALVSPAATFDPSVTVAAVGEPLRERSERVDTVGRLLPFAIGPPMTGADRA